LYKYWGSVQAVRPIAGVEVLLYSFMTNGTRRRWGVSVTLRPLLFPGKTRYPLYRRLGGLQGRSGQVRKISPPPGFDPRTVQPVASRYTDWVTRRTNTCVMLRKWLPSLCTQTVVTVQVTACFDRTHWPSSGNWSIKKLKNLNKNSIKLFIPSEHNCNTLVFWLHVSVFTKPSLGQC
jgi:hypothetical protein